MNSYTSLSRTLGPKVASMVAKLRPDQLESPIESLLAMAFEARGILVRPGTEYIPDQPPPKQTIFTQVRFPELHARTDFLAHWNWRFAVECDGREFHHREGKQVVRDYERDRRLLAAGIVTIRFTGGEIFKDPHACAAEVVRIAGG